MHAKKTNIKNKKAGKKVKHQKQKGSQKSQTSKKKSQAKKSNIKDKKTGEKVKRQTQKRQG